MEFRILGPIEAREDGAPVVLGGTKQRALLAVLLLHSNEVVSTEALVDALWDEPPAEAVKAVQVYASRLRKALGGGMPTSRPPGYVLELEPEQLDLALFRRLLEEARRDRDHAADKLAEALALWRGPALAEFTSEPFARVERLRLEELRVEAVEERIDADLVLGRHAALTGELEALVATHPLRERLRGQLMLALYRCGRQAEALAVHREGRRSLIEELGIEPSRQLQELERAILRQDPALEPSRAAATVAAQAAPATPTADTATGGGLGEERKVVSVLSVELTGFAARSGLADPEDVRAALRPFHSAAKRAIERLGGTIEKSFGDAVVAVFGAPVVHEDDAERAVRAALELRQWVSEESDGLQVRMAVNTGVALVSLDPHANESESIAAGDVIGTAQRLHVAAPVNGILVGEQTYRATREAIEYRAGTPVKAKGTSEQTPVWEALRASSRPGASVPREPRTPFVGRRLELDLLVSALARVREERSPQLVTLVGVPGIGKSRLVLEMFRIVDQRREPIAWRQGRCLPYGDGVSFWALGEAVKAQAGILESDSPAQAEEKLRSAVGEIVGETQDAQWVERELRPLIGLSGERGSVERAGEAFPAWRRFIEGIADLSPLVLVFEDLHWADEGLLEFVDELADRMREAPLLVLCTARPELLERRPSWGGGKANSLTISLPPLSDDEIDRVIPAVLEQPALEPDVHKTLLARAGGNPLYAEQFARGLAEIGSLDELPETVHGIIAARLDGLSPQEKTLLQDAAVVGKVFWLGAFETIGERSGQQAEELLHGLERKEFVQGARRSAVAGESEYAFRHALLRDVAYAQIPRAERGEKHRRAAVWIESLGRPDDHAEMLAHHYLSALEYMKATDRRDPDLTDRARLALRAAGDRALALASYPAAARFYSAALELWPRKDPERAWVLAQAGRASYATDGSGIDLLQQAFEGLQTRRDVDRAAEVAVDLARCSWLSGEREAAYEYIDRALEFGAEVGGSTATAHALVHRAAYHMIASEHADAVRVADEALQLVEPLRLSDLQVRALDVRGASRVLNGDPGGLDDSMHAVALGRASRAFSYLILAEFNLYSSYYNLGQLEEASATLSALREDSDRYGTAELRKVARGLGAYDDVLHGRWEDASQALDALIAETKSGATHVGEPSWRALRASIALARQELEAASDDSEEAVERARTIKDPMFLVPALVLRAVVLMAEGRREEASKLASEVLAFRSVLVPALLGWVPTPAPIDFAWLTRDLGREVELLSALEEAPFPPWSVAMSAIASGDFVAAIEQVARLGLPSVEAYTRLRAAEALVQAGSLDLMTSDELAPALAFFRQVSATRYVARAEQLYGLSC